MIFCLTRKVVEFDHFFFLFVSMTIDYYICIVIHNSTNTTDHREHQPTLGGLLFYECLVVDIKDFIESRDECLVCSDGSFLGDMQFKGIVLLCNRCCFGRVV